MKIYAVTDTLGMHIFWQSGHTTLAGVRRDFDVALRSATDLFFKSLDEGHGIIYAHPKHYSVTVYELEGTEIPEEVILRVELGTGISVNGKAYRTEEEARADGTKDGIPSRLATLRIAEPMSYPFLAHPWEHGDAMKKDQQDREVELIINTLCNSGG